MTDKVPNDAAPAMSLEEENKQLKARNAELEDAVRGLNERLNKLAKLYNAVVDAYIEGK